MWHCFLTGSRRDSVGRRTLEVLSSVEYLTYDLENKEIDVWGDFFVENISNEASRLRGLHRGNIKFELKTDTWLEDKRWTPILKRIAADYMGLEVRARNEVVLRRAGAAPLAVYLMKDTTQFKQWSPVRTFDGSYVCFTGWESPPIEPGCCCLFRICGTICGDTYDRLMGEHVGNEVQIMGGEPLEDMILNDLLSCGEQASDYERKYTEFVRKYNDKPDFYHVFFEFTDRRTVKIREVSEDLRKKSLNQVVDGRCISWYCSDMDFNIFAGANGPLLVLSADESAHIGS